MNDRGAEQLYVMRRARVVGAVVVVLLASVALAPARSVDPETLSAPIYGITPPSADPARQQHFVTAADGTEVFVETWLPAATEGNVPPERVPVIVSISPYLAEGVVESTYLRDTMVPRGYAYANVHVRGTGSSGGCIDLFGPTEADDSARAVEYLGRDAPFSDGNVGGYGISYPGGTLLSVAGRGDPARTHYLKVVVAGAPYHSMHEAQWTFDGVPSLVVSGGAPVSYSLQSLGFDLVSATYTPPPLDRLLERPGCMPGHILHGLDTSGNHTAWHRERDNRAWTRNITAATMIFHGHADLRPVGGSPPSIEVGLFDELPDTTPRLGLFGVFGHQRPPGDAFTELLVAWYDRWLKGVDTGVDDVPEVQVQGTDGAWFPADGWPATGGAPNELALGPRGTLGGPGPPRGSTSYVEALFETTVGQVPGTFATFETPPLPDGLELVGQPELDLWVKLSLPDAHIAARIQAFDAAGQPVPNGFTYGLRSAQHLQPLVDGRFVQAQGVPAPILRPLLVPVRFQPTAIVVPPGGRVRLTIAGSLIVNQGLSQVGVPEPLFLGPSQPSGLPTVVTILHDPAHPSTLRFLRR
jgi:predicted acyl esterase